jgi:A/G-specific adenine glycosylase
VAERQLRLRLAGPQSIEAAVAALLAWYARERRDLPWRAPPGTSPDAYGVWLSEIMLQQTGVRTVIPYYLRFRTRWPDVAALAAAELDDVLAAWSGLGYYRRAHNLHRCARIVANDLGGRFPSSEAELRRLPGIGPYTAAAIAAIAFGASTLPLDGNVERVTARLFAFFDPLPGGKVQLARLAQSLARPALAGDVAQALMDLGASVCTPQRPSCLMCPLRGECAAHAAGLAEALPVKAAKPLRPERFGIAFLAVREDGFLLLRRRPAAGLLGGMLEVPSTPWENARPAPREALRAAPVRAPWWNVPGAVAHVFTHFRLELSVYRALVPLPAPLTFWADAQRCAWVARHELARQALPTVMRKVIAHGLAEA